MGLFPSYSHTPTDKLPVVFQTSESLVVHIYTWYKEYFSKGLYSRNIFSMDYIQRIAVPCRSERALGYQFNLLNTSSPSLMGEGSLVLAMVKNNGKKIDYITNTLWFLQW